MNLRELRARRWIIFILVLIVAGLLAFPLRGMIYESVVVPAAFIIWNLDLLYLSFSQTIWWWAIIAVVFFTLMFSLIPKPANSHGTVIKLKPKLGQVEELAISLRKAKDGIYYKWIVANRLGKLGYQVLLHRESGRPRSVFAPLMGADWDPSQELQSYLETGLHGSFADFPNANRAFGTPQKTPLDFDAAEAVKFLESQVENGQLPRRQRDAEI